MREREQPWRVILVENEARRVFEYFDSLLALGTGRIRPHVVGRPELPLGARIDPYAVLVGPPEARGQAEEIRADHPELERRLHCDPATFEEVARLYRLLDRLVDQAPEADVLVLWDDQLDSRWALAENANGMSLQFAARWAESLAARDARKRVRVVGISAQRDWTTQQKADLARFLRAGSIDDFRDRAHVDRLVAELCAGDRAERVEAFARVRGAPRRGAIALDALPALREELSSAARERVRAVARRLAAEPGVDVSGSWNPAFAGALWIDETAGTIEILEHGDRPEWARAAAWDAPDPETGKRRLATHVLREITDRTLRALREGGEPEADRWTWRRLPTGEAGLDLESVAYRLLRFLALRGDAVERHEIVRAGLAQDSAVNTYASRIRSELARHEILESVTRGGYRCARDLLLVGSGFK